MMVNSRSVNVCLSYARSGGTMLSSILGSHSKLCVFSEVNPKLNAVSSIKEQSKEWYGIEIQSDQYLNSIVELCESAKLENKRILIRDFSLIDFTPHILNNNNPLLDFGGIRQLETKFTVRKFAFVRDAYDVWISRDCPPQFGEHYLNYVRKIIKEDIPIFKYEKFCSNPNQELQKICEFLEVDFSNKIIEGVSSNKNTTGDISVKSSRGRNDFGEVKVLLRKQLPRFLIKSAKEDDFLKKANQLLGYSDDILNAKFESKSRLKVELKWFIRRILGRYPTVKF